MSSNRRLTLGVPSTHGLPWNLRRNTAVASTDAHNVDDDDDDAAAGSAPMLPSSSSSSSASGLLHPPFNPQHRLSFNYRRKSIVNMSANLAAEEIEKKLNEFLEDGNSHEFIAFLQEQRCSDFDINKRDTAGRTLLTRAIRLQNDDVVGALIDLDSQDLFSCVGGLKLDDAITHAIKETQLNIVDSLLEFGYRRGFILHDKSKKSTGQKGARSRAVKRKMFNEEKAKLTGNLCPDCLTTSGGAMHFVHLEPMRKSRDFTSDLVRNPLIQAAIMDAEEMENMATVSRNYDIIHVLIKKGNFELPEASLKITEEKDDMDDLSRAAKRLHVFRGLCSPSYISLKAVDIICHTFKLAVLLGKLANCEPEYNKEYEELRLKCETYSTALLSECRHKSEVELLLKKICEESKKKRLGKFPFPRINKAIELDQKLFVIHPACMKNIEAIWFQASAATKTSASIQTKSPIVHNVIVLVLLCIHTLLVPLTSMIIIFEDSVDKINQSDESADDDNKWHRFTMSKGFKNSRGLRVGERLAEFFQIFKKALNNPQVKCMRQTGAYVIFLFLLFLEVIKDKGKRNTVKYNQPPDKTEYLIMLMVLGFFVQEFRLLIRSGRKLYTSDFWNIYFLVTCSLFILAYTNFFVGKVVINTDLYNGGVDNETKKHYKIHDEKKIPYERYEMWDYNYILITEAIFSFATILAFARIMQIFQLHKVLGPLQLTIIRIASVVGHFLSFFFIFMFSITCGIHLVYINYADEWTVSINPMSGRIECSEQNAKFSTIGNTFSTLFSALFGLGEADDPDVLKRNLMIGDNHAHALTKDHRRQLCDSDGLSYEKLQDLMTSMNLTVHDFEPAKPSPSESLGYLIFGFYQVIAVVVLLNLLIAIMNSVWEDIKRSSDLIWKFNQTSFMLRFYDTTLAVPPPFNLIALFVSACVKIFIFVRDFRKEKETSTEATTTTKTMVAEGKGEGGKEKKTHICTATEEYKELQQELHQRYMISRAEEKLFKGKVTPELLNTVTEYLLREIHHCTELVLGQNEEAEEEEEGEDSVNAISSSPRPSFGGARASLPSASSSWDQRWNPGSLATMTRTKLMGRKWSQKGKKKIKTEDQKGSTPSPIPESPLISPSSSPFFTTLATTSPTTTTTTTTSPMTTTMSPDFTKTVKKRRQDQDVLREEEKEEEEEAKEEHMEEDDDDAFTTADDKTRNEDEKGSFVEDILTSIDQTDDYSLTIDDDDRVDDDQLDEPL